MCMRDGRRPVANVEAPARAGARAASAAPSPSLTEKHTVPTGLSSVPPPGPAIPVTPTPTPARRRSRAPSASASATSVETAPWRSISAGVDARELGLRRVGVDDQAAERSTSDEPGSSVRRPPSSPPVHDSATATVRRGLAQQPQHLLVDRRAVLGEQRVAVALADEPVERRRRPAGRRGRSA